MRRGLLHAGVGVEDDLAGRGVDQPDRVPGRLRWTGWTPSRWPDWSACDYERPGEGRWFVPDRRNVAQVGFGASVHGSREHTLSSSASVSSKVVDLLKRESQSSPLRGRDNNSVPVYLGQLPVNRHTTVPRGNVQPLPAVKSAVARPTKPPSIASTSRRSFGSSARRQVSTIRVSWSMWATRAAPP